MSDFEIFFEDDSELAEFEAIHKGYRVDVYIKIRMQYFNIRIIGQTNY